jgi:hypothetical protein
MKDCDVTRLTKRRRSALDLAKECNRKYSTPTVCDVLSKAMEQTNVSMEDVNNHSSGNASLDEDNYETA